MVDKVNLRSDKHTHAYLIVWFKKGNEESVGKTCLIKCSIGKAEYKDEIWCDLIPMYACDMLLGRQWNYDKKIDA